jgi:hypothetical protein
MQRGFVWSAANVRGQLRQSTLGRADCCRLRLFALTTPPAGAMRESSRRDHDRGSCDTARLVLLDAVCDAGWHLFTVSWDYGWDSMQVGVCGLYPY